MTEKIIRGVPVQTKTVRRTASNTPEGFTNRITLPVPDWNDDDMPPPMHDPLFRPQKETQ